jgi:hypothetical protein
MHFVFDLVFFYEFHIQAKTFKHHKILSWGIETLVVSGNKRSQNALQWLVGVKVDNNNCKFWK